MSVDSSNIKIFSYDSKSRNGMKFGAITSAVKVSDRQNVLVKVKAVSINPIDYKKIGIPVLGWGIQGRPASQDFAGVIEEILPNSNSKFNVGDAVYGNADGCLADKIWVDSNEIALKPKSLTFGEASSLPTVALTSLQALEGGDIKEGSKVVVVGASGGCGLAGLMIARKRIGPSGTLVAICGSSSDAFVKSFDVASEVLHYNNPDTIVGPSSILHHLKPFDIVYDTVTSPDGGDNLNGVTYDEALSPFLAPKGIVCAINGGAWRWIGALTGWNSCKYRLFMKKRSGSQLEELAEMADSGALKAVIDSVHPFTEDGVRGAFDKLKSRRAKGKIVIDVDGADSK